MHTRLAEERYHRELKRHITPSLTVDDYSADPELWLMSAAWRCRITGDPLVKLGELLQGSADDEQHETREKKQKK